MIKAEEMRSCSTGAAWSGFPVSKLYDWPHISPLEDLDKMPNQIFETEEGLHEKKN
jgi:hypothetical protein